MEGPSLHLAAEQLKPLVGQRVLDVSGITLLDKERMQGNTVLAVFAWGKHLVIQFDVFALRTHFLLFGTFEARIDHVRTTGDYERARTPKLELRFANGTLKLFNCSLAILEGRNVRRSYDFAIDILSRAWDTDRALATMKEHRDEQIADVLLDQTVFAGVGNIIKTEALWLQGIHPEQKVSELSTAQRKKLITGTRAFSKLFFRWRKADVLRKNLRIYGRKECPNCGGPVTKKETGKRKRTSHWCPRCQPR